MGRILMLIPDDLDVDTEFDAALCVTEPQTDLVRRAVRLPLTPPLSAQEWSLADLAVTAVGQTAEAEGFDAVCLADFGDYGAPALRSLLSIPVVSAGRASMLHALTLAERFSILATDRDATRARKLVHDFGLSSQCHEIRQRRDIDQQAEESSLFRPGEVIILAGHTKRPSSGEPDLRWIRPLPLLVKLAESLLALRLTHSRRSYPEPETRKPDLLRSLIAAVADETGKPKA